MAERLDLSRGDFAAGQPRKWFKEDQQVSGIGDLSPCKHKAMLRLSDDGKGLNATG